MSDPDVEPDPEEAEADDRILRAGFNPLMALAILALIALAAFAAFAAFARGA